MFFPLFRVYHPQPKFFHFNKNSLVMSISVGATSLSKARLWGILCCRDQPLSAWGLGRMGTHCKHSFWTLWAGREPRHLHRRTCAGVEIIRFVNHCIIYIHLISLHSSKFCRNKFCRKWIFLQQLIRSCTIGFDNQTVNSAILVTWNSCTVWRFGVRTQDITSCIFHNSCNCLQLHSL